MELSLERTTGFEPATPTLGKKKGLHPFTGVRLNSSWRVEGGMALSRLAVNRRERPRTEQIGA